MRRNIYLYPKFCPVMAVLKNSMHHMNLTMRYRWTMWRYCSHSLDLVATADLKRLWWNFEKLLETIRPAPLEGLEGDLTRRRFREADQIMYPKQQKNLIHGNNLNRIRLSTKNSSGDKVELRVWSGIINHSTWSSGRVDWRFRATLGGCRNTIFVFTTKLL